MNCQFSAKTRHRSKWCALFTSVICAPLIAAKHEIEKARQLFDIEKILAAGKKIHFVLENVPAMITFTPDPKEEPIHAILKELTMTLDNLKNTTIPPELLDLPKKIANEYETSAWIVGGSLAFIGASVVAYQYYYSKFSSDAESEVFLPPSPLHQEDDLEKGDSLRIQLR